MNAHVKPPTSYPCLPPAAGIPRQDGYDPAARARQHGHPLAHLMRLRDEAAAEVERLLAFLDATDGCEDVELNGDEEEPNLTGDIFAQPWTDECEGDCCEDEGAQCDDEGHEESGVADFDGYMEQCPALFQHCDVRVDA
jgi:hypothetical protein